MSEIEASKMRFCEWGSEYLQKSGGKALGFNRGMKAKKLFAIIGQ